MDVPLERSETTTLYVFSKAHRWELRPDHCIRRWCIAITQSVLFERLVLVVIIANCCLMAWDAPGARSAGQSELIDRLDLYFLYIFTFETLLRLVAHGPHCSPGGFFALPWVRFEGAIVAIAWLPLILIELGMPASEEISRIARSFRALRVLLIFDNLPSMKALVEAAFWSIPSLGSVSGVCLFIIGVMAVKTATAVAVYGSRYGC